MNDDLQPARGCAVGLLIGMFLWILIFGGAAVIVSILARAT